MSTTKKVNFYESEQGVLAIQALRGMVSDSTYHTKPSYSASQDPGSNNSISFVDKHMKYLSEHQSVNVEHYLANLRLMTRVRS